MKKMCALICIALFFSSCATIIHGKRQNITITSDPAGATVSDGKTTYTTPAVLKLRRNQDYTFTITKKGYKTETVTFKHVVSAVVGGNIILGGFIGWGIDASDGAQWRLEPEAVSVTLQPLR